MWYEKVVSFFVNIWTYLVGVYVGFWDLSEVQIIHFWASIFTWIGIITIAVAVSIFSNRGLKLANLWKTLEKTKDVQFLQEYREEKAEGIKTLIIGITVGSLIIVLQGVSWQLFCISIITVVLASPFYLFYKITKWLVTKLIPGIAAYLKY